MNIYFKSDGKKFLHKQHCEKGHRGHFVTFNNGFSNTYVGFRFQSESVTVCIKYTYDSLKILGSSTKSRSTYRIGIQILLGLSISSSFLFMRKIYESPSSIDHHHHIKAQSHTVSVPLMSPSLFCGASNQ